MQAKKQGMFGGLGPIEQDALLQLMLAARADTRGEKIDAGVGVYKTSAGDTPVMEAIRVAEERLHEEQETKAYLGMQGDQQFVHLLAPILFDRDIDDRLIGLQTPGGCGALTLGCRLVRAAQPGSRVLVGTPTWPNHQPIIKGSGLQTIEYDYYDPKAQTLNFDAMVAALEAGQAGDVALLHGCCHNPTGADLDLAQWEQVTRIVADKGIIPFVDIAYQGLGDGLDEDAAGLRMLDAACGELIVAQSCDKNFGMYRDRVGALFVKTKDGEADRVMGHIQQIAREMWSMPPDHGAACVRIALGHDDLRELWSDELASMRGRINALRQKIADSDARLAYIGSQKGMFSMLPISRDQVDRLRDDYAIYMAGSGRFNICGLADDQVDYFTTSVIEVMDG